MDQRLNSVGLVTVAVIRFKTGQGREKDVEGQASELQQYSTARVKSWWHTQKHSSKHDLCLGWARLDTSWELCHAHQDFVVPEGASFLPVRGCIKGHGGEVEVIASTLSDTQKHQKMQLEVFRRAT